MDYNLKSRQVGVRSQSASDKNKPQVDPQQCTIQMGFPGSQIDGNRKKAVVQAVDTNGQRMTTGGANVQIKQVGFISTRHGQVADNKDGTYTFEYSLHYSQLYVSINGTPMKGSPFSL